MNKSNSERRKHSRALISMRVDAFDGGPPLIAHEISTDGMLVSSKRPRWPGQHIRIRFELPNDERGIRATCRVMTLEEAKEGVGLGVQFLSLAQEAKETIALYIEQKRRQSPLRLALPV